MCASGAGAPAATARASQRNLGRVASATRDAYAATLWVKALPTWAGTQPDEHWLGRNPLGVRYPVPASVGLAVRPGAQSGVQCQSVHSFRERRSWLVCAGMLLMFAACDPAPVTSSNGGDGPDTTGNGGAVQRATLNVSVSIDTADAALATAAGFGVEGLTVRLVRPASSEPPMTALTGSTGIATFSNLQQGAYQVSVERILTATEIARLPEDARDATIFAGGTSLSVAPPTASVAFDLVAARRGSLVISEVYIYNELVPGAGNYGHYVELYNNGDTTVRLDGMLLFRTQGLHACSAPPALQGDLNADMRLDAGGVWAYPIHRFPSIAGDARLEVRAGQARVVALDAVDHRPVGSGMQDLRQAQFEFIGDAADPDNPSALNMIRMTRFVNASHGMALQAGGVIGIALPVAQDTTQLERRVALDGGSYFRIPSAAVLDVLSQDMAPEVFAIYAGTSLRRCEPFAAPEFDRAPAQLTNFSVPKAIARKPIGFTPAGAEILQDTRNSSRDFELAQPLRRSLARPPG